MKVLSMFANIGVAEAYLSELGVNVVLANELIPRRAELYSKIYPETQMICGDITDPHIYAKILSAALSEAVDVIMATPPCQGISRAGRQDENDQRNLLILPVLACIQDVLPRYALIENVPQFIETTIKIDGQSVLILDHIKRTLGDKYDISVNVIDTKNYSVPQTRQRAIILLTRNDQTVLWRVPEQEKRIVSVRDAIGDLPSLDPYVSDVPEEVLLELFPSFYEKKAEAKKVSRWHKPPAHIMRQVVTMIHTPTGKTAFDNPKYIPIKADGTPVKGYKSTYRRLRWDDPASTVTMDNRKISSQNNVHPGRYIGTDSAGEVQYSDARALTLFELMRIMSIPDNWPLPHDTNEAFIRSVIGEGIPPLFIKKLFMQISEVLHEKD